MSSIEGAFKNLRIAQVSTSILGENKSIYKGMPHTRVLTLNEEGVAYLVEMGHKFLTTGDQVSRNGMSFYDAPGLNLAALKILTNLLQPVKEDPSKPFKYVEQFPIDRDLFEQV